MLLFAQVWLCLPAILNKANPVFSQHVVQHSFKLFHSILCLPYFFSFFFFNAPILAVSLMSLQQKTGAVSAEADERLFKKLY